MFGVLFQKQVMRKVITSAYLYHTARNVICFRVILTIKIFHTKNDLFPARKVLLVQDNI